MKIFYLAAMSGVLFCLGGCAALPPERGATVTPVLRGQVILAEPRVLPKSAVLDIAIVEPGAAEGGAVAKARQRVSEGEAPMQFAIPVAPGALNPAKEYLVLATVRSGDQTLMSNLTLPSRFPGSDNDITVVLRAEPGF